MSTLQWQHYNGNTSMATLQWQHFNGNITIATLQWQHPMATIQRQHLFIVIFTFKIETQKFHLSVG